MTTRTPALDRPLGLKAASLEAARLVDPASGRTLSVEELATLSPTQVSRLDPLPDHPAIRPVAPGNHFAGFLREMTRLIRASGKKAERFDPVYASRILVFDELKTDASSPKIKAKDRYGLTWRVKWGDEVHADVVATRLAIDLGATYADLKFWSGPGETLLILPTGQGPDVPSDQQAFERIMLNSKFRFHLRRYVVESPSVKDGRGNPLGTGRVDAAMIERESLDPKYLGCVYLAFKECQVSLENPVLKRLGGVDLNRGRALEDRVARSSMVFNAWINNPDTKEDNTSGGLLPDPATGKETRYVEFQSDMGASFAGPLSAGCLSLLSPNCVTDLFGVQHQDFHVVFLPDCWRSSCPSARPPRAISRKWLRPRIPRNSDVGTARYPHGRAFSNFRHPGSGIPKGVRRYLRLLGLIRDVEKALTVFGITPRRWMEFMEEPLATRGPEALERLGNCLTALKTIFPRNPRDHLLQVAVERGYPMWSIMTLQIGGKIPGLRPLAPRTPTSFLH